MKLAVFVSDFKITVDTLERLNARELGIIFVGNGVYHTTIKEDGKPSALLGKSAKFYVLSEDLETRGLSTAQVSDNVRAITYNDLVDLIFNDYEKLGWL